MQAQETLAAPLLFLCAQNVLTMTYEKLCWGDYKTFSPTKFSRNTNYRAEELYTISVGNCWTISMEMPDIVKSETSQTLASGVSVDHRYLWPTEVLRFARHKASEQTLLMVWFLYSMLSDLQLSFPSPKSFHSTWLLTRIIRAIQTINYISIWHI